MKKRLLALILVIAMLVSVAPAAFALELPDVGDVGDIDTDRVQAVIMTLSDYVNRKLGSTNDPSENPSYDACHGEYEVTSDSYYVSLGDSTVTGMSAANGSNPEGYGNYGYKTIVKECFPYKLAKKLGLNTETQYIQLAMGAFRTLDLRYVLDESFTPDAYTMNYLMKRINENAGGIDAMRADYKAALAKADLVTLSIGSNNFGNFVSMQLNGMVADIIKSNKELMNLLNGPMGAQIKPMITNMVDLEAEYYELNWDSYLDAEGWAVLNDISAEIRAMLVEMGIPETIDGGEIIQSVLNEQFGVHPITGKPFVTANIDLPIPAHDLAVKAVEQCIYGYVSHAFNYSVVVDKIHEISDAEVILLSMYNPVDEVVGKLGDAEMPIGELIGKVMKGMSKYALGYAARHSDNTTYVDIYDTESNLDRYLNEKSNVIEAMEFGSIYAGADNHATAEGHSYIAEQIYNALDLVKDEPIVNPFKDVAEKDYFFKPVMWAVQNGVTTGTSATTFSPNSTVTRGQAVTFLWRAAGEPTPKTTKNPFTDVKKSDYFYEAVLWAVENGITLGTSAKEFSPKNTCSTAHIVTFIYRTLGIGSDGWYKEAAAWAEQEGLLTGTGANVLPREDCPRANVVTFIYRAYK